MGLPALKNEQIYTYGDYRTWPDDERWELLDGVAYDMSPAPSRFHQGMLTGFFAQIVPFLEGKPCKVYVAPFDVLLPDFDGQEENAVRTVVQPDISVICDKGKLTSKGCTGAPDWIVEILSPHTSRKDFNQKLRLYERHGVREYWIADPGNRYVLVHVLGEGGKYPENPELHLADAEVPCRVLEGLLIRLSRVFAEAN